MFYDIDILKHIFYYYIILKGFFMNRLHIVLLSLLIAPQDIFASGPEHQSMENPQNFTKLSRLEQCASTCCCACCVVPALIMSNERCSTVINKGYALTKKTFSNVSQLLKGRQYIQWPVRTPSPHSSASSSLYPARKETLAQSIGYKNNKSTKKSE